MRGYTVNNYDLGRNNLRELTWLKQQARRDGFNDGKMVEHIPNGYNDGYYAEIAVMGILGLTQSYFKTKDIKFWIQATTQLDKYGVDVQINNETLQIKSKYSYNTFFNFNPDYCYIEYDAIGMENLMTILDHINFPKVYMTKPFMVKINKLWSQYMKRFDLI